VSPPPFHIVFALFPGLTHLDFTGPHAFLSRIPGAQVHVASLEGGELEAEGGLVFGRTERLADIPACDLLCVPGGVDATAAALVAPYVAEVRRLGLSARYVTSVCTGSLVLGAAGLLKGKRATTHWASHDFLAALGAIPVQARVVRDGNLLTGGGVTAGIDFALTLAAELMSPEAAQAIQLQIEYSPSPPFRSGTPQEAPAAVLDAAKIAEMRRSFGEIGDQRLTVMAAITIADEMSEARRKIETLQAEVASVNETREAALHATDGWATALAEALDAASARIEGLTQQMNAGWRKP